MTPSRIAAWVPELAPDAAASLPPRRPLLLRRAAAVAAGAAAAALVILVPPHPPSSDRDALLSAVALVPWALSLPWLKKLDLRPVLWFFGCVLCVFLSPVLAGRVAYRALSLPYRDWEIAQWHGGRAWAVPGEHAVVVLGEPDGQVARSPGEDAWRRFLSVGWGFVIVLFASIAVAEAGGVHGSTADALQVGWISSAAVVGVIQLLGEFLLGRAEPRKVEAR